MFSVQSPGRPNGPELRIEAVSSTESKTSTEVILALNPKKTRLHGPGTQWSSEQSHARCAAALQLLGQGRGFRVLRVLQATNNTTGVLLGVKQRSIKGFGVYGFRDWLEGLGFRLAKTRSNCGLGGRVIAKKIGVSSLVDT